MVRMLQQLESGARAEPVDDWLQQFEFREFESLIEVKRL
jgi:hypothetical protein